MADSIEQKLVTRALAVLAAINGTGSYQTTLGTTSVAGSRVQSLADSRVNWEQDELPAISVFQGVTEVEERVDEGQIVIRKLRLVIRGWLSKGTDAQTARKFLSDIMRAMRAAGDTWIVSSVPLAERTEEGAHEISYSESYEVAGVEQEVIIYYAASNLDMDS